MKLVDFTAVAACSILLSNVNGDLHGGHLSNELQWETSLGFTLDKGNVVEWINAGENILVTGAHCDITILDKFGSVVVSRQGSNETHCKSGLTHMPDGTFLQTVNYMDSMETESYILCLESDDLSMRWNVSVPGAIMGTPVVGDYVYFTSNGRNTTTGEAIAHFTVMSPDGGSGFRLSEKNIFFTPLSLKKNPIRGPYSEGANNRNDLLVWTKMYSDDSRDKFDRSMALFFYQLPRGFTGTWNDVVGTTIRNGGVNGLGLSAPTIADTFTDFYLGLDYTSIRGWVSTMEELKWWGQFPNLKINPPQGSTKVLVPPPTGPVVSSDGTKIFQSGSKFNPAVYAFNGTGTSFTAAWTFEGFVAQTMKLVMDDEVLILMKEGTNTSQIFAIDVDSGNSTALYEIGLSHCEFSVLNDTYVAYATNSGNVGVIKINNVTGDLIRSDAPSQSPSQFVPTKSPTSTPTPAPTAIILIPTKSSPAPTTNTPAPTPRSSSPKLFSTLGMMVVSLIFCGTHT